MNNKTENFKGTINGIKYTSKEDYLNDLKKLLDSNINNNTSISFEDEEEYEEEYEDDCCDCCGSCRCCKDESIETNEHDKINKYFKELKNSKSLNDLFKTHNIGISDILPEFSNSNSIVAKMMKDPFQVSYNDMKDYENAMYRIQKIMEENKYKVLKIIDSMTDKDRYMYSYIIKYTIQKLSKARIACNIQTNDVKNENLGLTENYANKTAEYNNIQAKINIYEQKIKELKEKLNNIDNQNAAIDKIEHNKNTISHLKSLTNILFGYEQYFRTLQSKIDDIIKEDEKYSCKLTDTPDKPYTSDKGDCGKDPATEPQIQTNSKEVKSQKDVDINELLNQIFDSSDLGLPEDKKITLEDITKMLDCAKDLFSHTDYADIFKNESLNKSIIPSEEDAKNFLNILFGDEKNK